MYVSYSDSFIISFGINIFWPILKLVDDKLLYSIKSSTVKLYSLAILYNVSPFWTVYIV